MVVSEGIRSVKINNVSIFAQSDMSLRAVEYIVIVEHKDEEMGFKFVVTDSGKLIYLGEPHVLLDGVDIV